MARFIGRTQGARGEASRLGHSQIVAEAADWRVKIRTTVKRDPDDDKRNIFLVWRVDLETGAETLLHKEVVTV